MMRYEPERGLEFWRAARQRVEALARCHLGGVRLADAALHLQLQPGRDSRSTPAPTPRGSAARRSRTSPSRPGYLATLGVRLLEGRDFSAADTEGAPGVVIVNETMARRFWPNESAARAHRVGHDAPAAPTASSASTAITSSTACSSGPAPFVYLAEAQRPQPLQLPGRPHQRRRRRRWWPRCGASCWRWSLGWWSWTPARWTSTWPRR